MTNHAPALSDTLVAAAHVLADVESGRSLTEAITHIPTELRPSTQALAFYAMRHWGLAKGLTALLVQRAPPNPVVSALIGLSLVLLEASLQAIKGSTPSGTPLYAVHTLVDQSVSATQLHRDLVSYRGMVNAVLRRFQRERDALLSKLNSNLEARYNHPAWWVHRLRRAYPDQWQRIFEVSNTPPPLTLRINRRRATVTSVVDALAAQGLTCTVIGLDSLIVDQPRGITSLAGYHEGWWSVQDAGAQLAAGLLEVKDGMRVLDACAAPGGKTAHLLELANIELTALDVDESRLDRVQQNLKRLGLLSTEVHLKVADASLIDSWWDKKPFEVILADVPCTASGIVRRHPDIRWLRQEKDIDRMAKQQREILHQLWQTLAPGGKLLLVTCSVFPQEGELLASEFAEQHSDAMRLAAPGQLLPVTRSADHSQHDHDGFFYALFARSA